MSALAKPPTDRRVETLAELTPRQQQIALMIGEGLTNNEIAEALEARPSTVRNHITELAHRLGFETQTRQNPPRGRRVKIAKWVWQQQQPVPEVRTIPSEMPFTARYTSEITVRLTQHIGGDHMVAAAAKVSTSGDEALQWALAEYAEDVGGLIRYLMRHRHASPFEHGQVTFFVHAPLFVMREWQRHRSWSFNEESGRYKTLEPVFWAPSRARKLLRTERYKPSRPTFEALPSTPTGDSMYAILQENSQYNYESCYYDYLLELEQDIAPEVARRLLPLGLYSSMWATANPRWLMSFLSLRINHAGNHYETFPQAEIQAAAEQCEACFAEHWPLTHAAWNMHGRIAL